MDVSVIIVTRNTCELTCTAIRSVLESRDSLVKEVIVMDNGSSDDTSQTLPQQFSGMRYCRNEENLGFARSANLAARQASGEWLLLLNSDACLEPDALERAVSWMEANPNCGVAGAQLLNPDGSRQNSIANFPTLATELLNKSILRRLFPRRFPGKEHPFTAPVEVETVIGAFMLVRREIWDRLGGLDERFFFFFEETDFCLRVRQAGKTVMHLPGVKVRHGQGQTAKQISAAARIEYWRSRDAYFAKNHNQAVRAVLAAGLVMRLLVDWIAATGTLALTLGGSARHKERWKVLAALWLWQLHGRPADMGLPRPKEIHPGAGR